MAEVLQEIIEAEKQAKKIKEDALQKYNALVAHAALDAQQLLLEKAEEIKSQKVLVMKAIQKDLDELHKKIVGENEKSVASLQKGAEKSISKAAEFVKTSFVESVE